MKNVRKRVLIISVIASIGGLIVATQASTPLVRAVAELIAWAAGAVLIYGAMMAFVEWAGVIAVALAGGLRLREIWTIVKVFTMIGPLCWLSFRTGEMYYQVRKWHWLRELIIKINAASNSIWARKTLELESIARNFEARKNQ